MMRICRSSSALCLPVIASPAVAVVCAPIVPRLYRKLGRTRTLALCALLVGLSVVPDAVAVPWPYVATVASAINAVAGVILLALPSSLARRFPARRVAPLHAPPRFVADGARRPLVIDEVARHCYRSRLYYQMVRYRSAINRSDAHHRPAVVAQAAAAAAGRRRRGLRRTFGGAAAVAPSLHAPRGFLPLAVQRTYLLLSLGFALVSGGASGRGGALGRAPETACAAALQLLAGGVAFLDRERLTIGACAVLASVGALLAALPLSFSAWAAFACSIAATAPVGRRLRARF